MNKNKTFLAAALVALAASLPVHAATDYTRTRYPIVLSHGLFGFKSVGPVDYWHAIVPALEKDGAKVFATSQSPVNSNEVRGEQLLAQVEEVLALTGAEKVNLIGHSQGGMTVRYVAGVAPQLVASVTTMGTPHKGTPVADAVIGFSEFLGPIGTEVIASAVEALFSVVDIVDGGEWVKGDALAALNSLNTPGTARFNQRFPQAIPASACGQGAETVAGVRYYSMSGTGSLTNALDPSSAGLAVTGLLFGEANDGLVGQCSSHLGSVVKDNYRMDHLDEVNQLLGLVSLFESDPTQVYRQHANRLRNVGL
ncbi:lipase LipC [Pseudomonas aeruginosa]|uniref:lipase LipC n=1 Tax=Pseudomonas aeruginosa TaxID=287 RepID=UPI000EB5E65E|nr:lipase LipC [Pseudomonas aeruginosa]HEK3341963.1 lipase LipC [Pseudomonas aeruginosa]